MKRPILKLTYLQNKLRPHNGSYLSLALCVDKFRTVPTSWFRSFEPNFVRISIVAVPICSLLTDRFVPSWTGLVSDRLYRIYSISIAFYRPGFFEADSFVLSRLVYCSSIIVFLSSRSVDLFLISTSVITVSVYIPLVTVSLLFTSHLTFLYLVLGRVNYSLISLFNNGRN